MTARRSRPDPLDKLRKARNEMEEVRQRLRDLAGTGDRARSGERLDEHLLLTGWLEEAHAHMVGEAAAEQALVRAFNGPRPTGLDRRFATSDYEDLLRSYGYHHCEFRQSVWSVRDWIDRFGLPSRSAPEAER